MKSSILDRIVDPTNGADVLDFESLAEEDKKVQRMNDAINSSIGGDIGVSNYQPPKQHQQVREYKYSRNEPCPCGSGKKYKKCCLNKGTYENLVDAQ